MEDDVKKEDAAAGDANPGESDAADEATSTSEEATEAKKEEAEQASDDSSESSDGSYQFDDDLSASGPSAPAPQKGGGGNGGRFADELFTKTIHAKFRTFYVDLKESSNGKFVKVSEKSRGRKSTIMMDAEDVPAMIEALQEAQAKL